MKIDFFAREFRSAGKTDIGKKRSENEDRILMNPEWGFFAVSDGMGGLRFGDRASAYVSEAMPALFADYMTGKPENLPPEEGAKQLEEIIGKVSDALFHKGNERENGHPRFDYGATLAGVWLYQDSMVYFCLGDSRGYVLKKDAKTLRQVTQDMNMAGVMVRNGLMTRSEAARSPASCRLTAFVGMEAPATPETFVLPAEEGDTVLICSDGLHGMVPEREIVRILRENEEPEAACEELIRTANERGGRDNISAIVIRIG